LPQNARIQLSIAPASWPRRTEFSVTPLQKNSQSQVIWFRQYQATACVKKCSTIIKSLFEHRTVICITASISNHSTHQYQSTYKNIVK